MTVPEIALVNDRIRNRLILLTVVLLLGLSTPWRLEIHKPVIDRVALGASSEAVVEAWGEPHVKEDDEKFWSYSVTKSVEMNSVGEVVAVSGSTLTLDDTRIPCKTAWITKLILGPPTRVSYGDSLGDAWIYETLDLALVFTVMDRYTHNEIISVSLRHLD